MATDLLNAPTTKRTGDDDQTWAHIVSRDGLTEAYVLGTPVTALCGYTWVPSRDPDRYPLCEHCAELNELLLQR